VRPVSAFHGLEVRVTDWLTINQVGSTLYADRGPPFGLRGIIDETSTRCKGAAARISKKLRDRSRNWAL
jgi:hypothetical protein